jgi:hypothetical protein
MPLGSWRFQAASSISLFTDPWSNMGRGVLHGRQASRQVVYWPSGDGVAASSRAGVALARSNKRATSCSLHGRPDQPRARARPFRYLRRRAGDSAVCRAGGREHVAGNLRGTCVTHSGERSPAACVVGW